MLPSVIKVCTGNAQYSLPNHKLLYVYPTQRYHFISFGISAPIFFTILFSILIVCFEKRMKGLETKVLFFQTNQYCHTAFARLAISSS